MLTPLPPRSTPEHAAKAAARTPPAHQVEKVTTSSTTSQCASARDSGAGPRIFFPSELYWLPWQGHMNCGGAGRGGAGARGAA